MAAGFLVALLAVPPTSSVQQADQGSLCRAVIEELAVEVLKFDMRSHGEDDIYETVGAVCFAIVRSYKLAPSSSSGGALVLERRDDGEDARARAADPTLQAYRRVKAECEAFVEVWQQELSELLYASVLRSSAAQMAEAFCPRVVAAQAEARRPDRQKRKATASASSRLDGAVTPEMAPGKDEV